MQLAQHSAGGRDTRFLRDEIRQMESQLEQKDKELDQMEKDRDDERKNNEKVRPDSVSLLTETTLGSTCKHLALFL